MRSVHRVAVEGRTYDVTFDGPGEQSALALIKLHYQRSHGRQRIGATRTLFQASHPRLGQLSASLHAVVATARRDQVLDAFRGAEPQGLSLLLCPEAAA